MLIKSIRSPENCHVNQISIIEQEFYDNPWTVEHFMNDINHNNSINYIYVKNNKIKGYLSFFLTI